MAVTLILNSQDARGDNHCSSLRYLRLGVFTLCSLSLADAPRIAATLRPQEIIHGIDKAQEKREQRLEAYVAFEHYTVRNSHFDETAELAAKVHYQREQGKRYQVLWRKGPHFLQERVINRILTEDAILSRRAERSHLMLTSANYSMTVQGLQLLEGEECYVVSIHPRAHNFSLIEGKAWVDTKTFSLLRIEGRPAASPSFWTGRPLIEREYMVLDGLSFPKHSRATSRGFISGKSELDIDYSQYEFPR